MEGPGCRPNHIGDSSGPDRLDSRLDLRTSLARFSLCLRWGGWPVGRSHQQSSSSLPEGTSPSYLRPPSSGAGTFLPQAGGQPLVSLAGGAGTFLPQAGRQLRGGRTSTRELSLRLRRERRRRRSREGGAFPPTALKLPARGISPSYLRPPSSGAGTFLPQAGGQPLASLAGGAGTFLPQAGGQLRGGRTSTRELSLRLRRERRRRRSREGGAVPPTELGARPRHATALNLWSLAALYPEKPNRIPAKPDSISSRRPRRSGSLLRQRSMRPDRFPGW
jgi:hypothetical protein